MLVTDIITDIRANIGDIDSTNYRYSDNVYRDTFIPSGIKRFNLQNFLTFTITGTGNEKVFDPTPTEEQTTRIALHTAVVILNSEIQKAAHSSVVQTNPAGRTDLTQVAKDLRTQRDTLKDELSLYEGGEKLTNVSKEIEVSDDKI
jgi:hypothetical protein